MLLRSISRAPHTKPFARVLAPNCVEYKRGYGYKYVLRSTSRKFSSMSAEDAEYAAFLEKANRDYSKPAGGAVAASSTQGSEGVVATPVPEDVHPAIKALQGRTYSSEVDEEFVPVALGYRGDGLPSEEVFGRVLGAPNNSKIQAMKLEDWDHHGDYKDVRDAVAKIVGGNAALVKVYKVSGRSARVEYYVVGIVREKGLLEGVKVLSVES